jgi:hypothetical protein
MSLIYEERLADSSYVETIIQGRTLSVGSSVRPAESCWHLVFARHHGRVHSMLVGPLTAAGMASWGEDAEVLWIRFKLGVFMHYLPLSDYLNTEINLPGAGSQSFWLNGSAWQFPDYQNVETFVARLVRDDVLVRDPVVNGVLQGHPVEMSSRTLRHRFLRATGLSHNRILQIKRARQAAALLQQGVSILDAVFELGYYDQPHLTRALKQWVGQTPAQIRMASQTG